MADRLSDTPGPDIDHGAIEAFCDIAFGYLEGLVPIRLFAEKGTPSKPSKLPFVPIVGAAEHIGALAPAAARDGYAVFVVPGTVETAGKAGAADIHQSGVVLVDIDEGDTDAKRDHLARHLGDPTLEVASGGRTGAGHDKLHLYWRLSEPAEGADLARLAHARAEIAERIGGDPSFASLHQPIRVPGTIHGKDGIQSAVRVLAQRPIEFHLADLADAVAGLEPFPGVAGRPRGADRPQLSTRDLKTTVIHEGSRDTATRFEALSRVIGHWIRAVRTGDCDVDNAWTAVREHNAAMVRPPWPEERLRGEFEALLAKDIRERGPLPRSECSSASGAPGETDAPAMSDDALAAAFVDAYGQDWRHVATWGCWYRWTGTVWARDETGRIREHIRQVCRTAAATADTPNNARRIASDRTIQAVLRIVAADPAIASAPGDWDAHRLLLNTPEGVVDLETGEVQKSNRDLLLTQITNASCGSVGSRWSTFLEEITGGDRDLEAYLSRLAGYCLTGLTREEVFVFLYGTGSNGKSKFVEAIAGVMGSYAATATHETFMASRHSRHLTELAGLRAARLVRTGETESGAAWNEQRIKTVTGGETIRANFMRQDHFEYQPVFKLLVSGNHRPRLSGVGEAMRRRLHLVPFEVTIPPERRDPQLSEKLLEERDGILGWMIAGCAEWQRIGLAPPACVTSASAAYFDAEDLVSQWIDEACEIGPQHRTTSAALLQSWRGWAEVNGHAVGSARALGEALSTRGFEQVFIRRGQRGRSGIAPRVATAAEPGP